MFFSHLVAHGVMFVVTLWRGKLVDHESSCEFVDNLSIRQYLPALFLAPRRLLLVRIRAIAQDIDVRGHVFFGRGPSLSPTLLFRFE